MTNDFTINGNGNGYEIDNDPDELGISEELFDTINCGDSVVIEPWSGHEPERVACTVTDFTSSKSIRVEVDREQGMSHDGTGYSADRHLIYLVDHHD